jgi:hypothetical protein
VDHADVRERLEIAAAEPGGLDRLMAGDTADAAAVAGHLAGCDACREEFGRLRRASGLIRDSIATIPPADLRSRTLAFVAAVGRDRSAPAPELVTAEPTAPAGRPAPLAGAGSGTGSGRMPTLTRARRAWALLAAAAALVVAIGATAVIVGSSRDAQLHTAQDEVAALSRVSATTVQIETRPDADSVPLAGTNDAGPNGSLLFSPSSRQLVIIATDLPRPPAGEEYRCWLEIGGSRVRIGRMFFGGDVAYWAGPVEALPQATAGTQFGVSLVDINTDSLGGPPVLSGQL